MGTGTSVNIVSIVQARMGATRFPGKVLLDIEGRPMLWHVVDRLRRSRLIGRIVVATSLNGENDAVEDFCENNSIDCYRGSETDVLDRYYQTARLHDAAVIVRITADCPLIDPVVTDKVVSAYIKNRKNLSGASNIIARTYPRGLDTEVVSFKALEECWRSARADYQREHVVVWIYENKDSYPMASVINNEDISGLRWTVDEEKDIDLVREIYRRLYKKGSIFLMKDILDLLKREPYLMDINKDVEQKPVA
jgi:spore coat polysaccharide biosynthesis protein SpsF